MKFTKKVKYCDIPVGTKFSITRLEKDLRLFEKRIDGAFEIRNSYGRECDFPIYAYLDMIVYVVE